MTIAIGLHLHPPRLQYQETHHRLYRNYSLSCSPSFHIVCSPYSSLPCNGSSGTLFSSSLQGRSIWRSNGWKIWRKDQKRPQRAVEWISASISGWAKENRWPAQMLCNETCQCVCVPWPGIPFREATARSRSGVGQSERPISPGWWTDAVALHTLDTSLIWVAKKVNNILCSQGGSLAAASHFSEQPFFDVCFGSSARASVPWTGLLALSEAPFSSPAKQLLRAQRSTLSPCP